jgi:hypothetical protein
VISLSVKTHHWQCIETPNLIHWQAIQLLQRMLGWLQGLIACLIFSFVANEMLTQPAMGSAVPVLTPLPPSVAKTSQRLLPRSIPTVAKRSSLSTGTYLFGESAKAGQLGESYLVFEVLDDRSIVGAFYAPRSSFDCFYGNAKVGTQLNLTAVDSYTQVSYSHTVPLGQLHQIPVLSAADQRLLAVCKAELYNQRPQSSSSEPINKNQ